MVPDAAADASPPRRRRLPGLDPRYARALRHYLRQALDQRFQADLPAGSDSDAEALRRYRAACRRLPATDVELIVGRVELNYSDDQLALATDRTSAAATRSAVKRALLRLAEEMESA